MASNNKTTAFESRLFPHFVLFNTELTVSNPTSDFLSAFVYQISLIEGLLENEIFTSDSITNFYGEEVSLNNYDYRNVSDKALNAIKSHGIEHSLAYQLFRMIYRYETYEVDGFRDDMNEVTAEREVITKTSFTPEKFNKSYLNPLARLYYKYAVSLEKEVVKTALFAKEKELPNQYKVEINVPTPYIVSEIFVSFMEENVIMFNIPDIFRKEVNKEYLTLPIRIEDTEVFETLRVGFSEAKNLYLSMITLDESNNLILRFDGLNIINEFFLNRRAAINQSNGTDSSDFFKVKLSELHISTEVKEEYSNSTSRRIRARRERTEFNMQNGVDETDYTTRVNRSKQIMHGIRNNRGDN